MESHKHRYKDYQFEIAFTAKSERWQTVYVFFKTQRGTWSSELQVAHEMLKEEKAFDYLCQSCLDSYIRRFGNDPVQVD